MSESTICTSISLYFQYRNVTSVLIVSVRSDLPFKAQKKRCDLHPFSSITREGVPFFGLPDLLYLSPTNQSHPFPLLPHPCRPSLFDRRKFPSSSCNYDPRWTLFLSYQIPPPSMFEQLLSCFLSVFPTDLLFSSRYALLEKLCYKRLPLTPTL